MLAWLMNLGFAGSVGEAPAPVSYAQDCLRAMLANSAAFQALVEADNATEADLSIYDEQLPAPANERVHTNIELQGYRPYAILTTDPDAGLDNDSDAVDSFDEGGRLYITLVRETPALHLTARMPNAAGILDWKNTIGQIIDDLCDLAGSQASGYLAMRRIGLEYGPFPSPPKDAETQGYWQGCILVVDY